jgi:hypothetical protein
MRGAWHWYITAPDSNERCHAGRLFSAAGASSGKSSTAEQFIFLSLLSGQSKWLTAPFAEADFAADPSVSHHIFHVAREPNVAGGVKRVGLKHAGFHNSLMSNHLSRIGISFQTHLWLRLTDLHRQIRRVTSTRGRYE